MVGKEFWADTKRGGKILVPDVTISSVLAWETEAEWTARHVKDAMVTFSETHRAGEWTEKEHQIFMMNNSMCSSPRVP